MTVSVEEFIDRVLLYCRRNHASITSWYRTVQHNSALPNSTVGSPHLFGLAVDVIYDAPLPLTERQTDAMRLSLTLVVEADHDHLQPVWWVNREKMRA